MPALLALAALVHGTVVEPLLWVIGIVLIIVGVLALFRGSVLAGVVLIVVGILLGGLNVV